MIYTVSAEDLIIFAESGGSNFRPGTIEDVIVFGDSVLVNINFFTVTEILALTDYALVNYTRAFSVTDELVFEDTVVPRSLFVTAEDFLFIYDYLELPAAGLISESLVLSDEAVMSLSKRAEADTLVFLDETIAEFIGIRPLNETLSLSDGCSSVLINSLTPDVPSGYTPPTVGLLISLNDGTQNLEILNPDFNDTDTTRYKRINRTSRGYSTIIAGIAGWPPFKTKKYTFTYLTEYKCNKIRAFARRNIGRPVTLTDMYGTTYSVIIQNPEFEVSQLGRENRSITLDFYVL